MTPLSSYPLYAQYAAPQWKWMYEGETARGIFRDAWAELLAHFFFIFSTCAGLGSFFRPVRHPLFFFFKTRLLTLCV